MANENSSGDTIQNFVGISKVSGGTVTQNLNNINKNEKQDLGEIIRLIDSLSNLAKSFPEEQREEAESHLQDVQEQVNNPDEKKKRFKLKAGLAALLAVSMSLGGAVATAMDFTNNVLELSNKLKIELPELFLWKLNQMQGNNQPQNTYDFSDLVGKLSWRGDAVVTQRKLRDEW